MKNTGKSLKSNGGAAAKSDGRKDRKSATGVDGSPKKGGHGGKFTWSGDGYSKAEIGGMHGGEIVDAKDPNFVDPEETEKL